MTTRPIRTALAGGASLVGLRVLGQCLELIAFVFFAKSLGPQDFGRLSVAFLIARYLGLAGDWGASFDGSRDVAAGVDADRIASWLRRRQQVTLGLTAAYIGGLLITGSRDVLPVAFLILAVGLQRDWISVGRQRGRQAATPAVVRGAIMLVGSLFAQGTAPIAWVIAAACAGQLAVSLGTNRWVARSAVKFRHDGWMLLAVLSAQIYTTIDTPLLALLRSDEEAGIYAALYRIPNGILTVVGLAAAWYLPIATNLVAEPGSSAAVFRRTWRVGAAGGLIVLLAAPAAVWLGPLIFGPEYRSGRTAMAGLLLSTALAVSSAPLSQLWLALGRRRRYAITLVLGSAANVLANFLLIPRFGMSGAAGATVLAEGLVLVIVVRSVRQEVSV